MTPPEISVIIVAWNSEEGLTECLGSLRESADAAGIRLESIVIDNGSSDGSLERAIALGCDIVVSNPVNAGYGVAAAQGLERAAAPWALLVNPDVVVDRPFVSALLTAVAAAPDNISTLVPDVRFASNRSIVNCRGLEIDDAGIPAEVEGATHATPVEAPREVFAGSSGACLLRLEAVRKVGGIEPAYFAYLEDVDLAWQLTRAGYLALLVPSAVAVHEGSASLGPESPLKAFLVARNRRLLFRLNGPHTMRARARRGVVELGHGTVATLSGGRLAPWRGRGDALRLRTYTRFVRRSRALVPVTAEPVTAARVSLVQALRRKRATRRAMVGE